MPKGRKKKAAAAVSHHEAKNVLEHLIRNRRISMKDLEDARKALMHEAESIMERLRDLGYTAAAGAVASVKAAGSAVADSAPVVRREVRKAARKITAERRAAMQLQGKYLGLIRQIPESQRAKFSAIAKEDSREKAITEMRKVLGLGKKK